MGMTRMNVEIRMPVYEIDGAETHGKADHQLTVKSHWNRTSDFVVLSIDGHDYTVASDAISKAISRATGF